MSSDKQIDWILFLPLLSSMKAFRHSHKVLDRLRHSFIHVSYAQHLGWSDAVFAHRRAMA